MKNLHDDGGHHVRQAELVSESSFAVRDLLRSLRQGPQSKAALAPKRVENPPQTCLENLVGLVSAAQSSPREQALLVRWCARIAVQDPWTLSRERAVIELGRLGRRLDCTGPGAVEPSPGSAAGPEQVRAALLDIGRAAARQVGPADDAAWQADFGAAATAEKLEPGSSPEPGDLPVACQSLAQLELDLDGALRALHGLTLVCGGGWGREQRLGPTLLLALDLERRCVRFALARALGDTGSDPAGALAQAKGQPAWNPALGPDSARVRAAAIEASALARGEDFVRELLDLGLEVLEPAPVAVAALRAIKRHGLPQSADPRERRDWIQSMLKLAVQSPDGQVRSWAMRALERATDGEISGLREEAAFRWYQERGRAEEADQP